MIICPNGWELLKEMVLNPKDDDTRKIAYDYFLDLSPEFAAHLQNGRPAHPRLGGDYDWGQAFEYAGQRDEYMTHGEPNVCLANPTTSSPVPLIPFDVGMVKEIYAIDDGENDVKEWLCVGRLWDGRFFALKAWCDYTGWD